ncbi:unnamed protein product [Amoebophrya sp. A120]|nr:unnamed protein product [Amoebophrya sp. A120]|eukprot:GSA120T00020259001.1
MAVLADGPVSTSLLPRSPATDPVDLGSELRHLEMSHLASRRMTGSAVDSGRFSSLDSRPADPRRDTRIVRIRAGAEPSATASASLTGGRGNAVLMQRVAQEEREWSFRLGASCVDDFASYAFRKVFAFWNRLSQKVFTHRSFSWPRRSAGEGGDGGTNKYRPSNIKR